MAEISKREKELRLNSVRSLNSAGSGGSGSRGGGARGGNISGLHSHRSLHNNNNNNNNDSSGSGGLSDALARSAGKGSGPHPAVGTWGTPLSTYRSSEDQYTYRSMDSFDNESLGGASLQSLSTLGSRGVSAIVPHPLAPSYNHVHTTVPLASTTKNRALSQPKTRLDRLSRGSYSGGSTPNRAATPSIRSSSNHHLPKLMSSEDFEKLNIVQQLEDEAKSQKYR